MEPLSPEKKKAKPKMVFKKRTFDKKPENGDVKSREPTDDISFFSRSKETFVSSAEIRQRELVKKGKEKAEKAHSSVKGGSPGKKRKSSDELTDDDAIDLRRSADARNQSLRNRYKNVKIIIDDSDDESMSSQKKSGDRGTELTPPPVLFSEPLLARPVPKLGFQTQVVTLSDSEPIPARTVLVTTIDGVDEAQEQNPALAAIERKARERVARMHGAQSPSVESQNASLGPCVSILVTSDIPKTTSLICKRRVGQTLKEVRLAWCNRQGFDEDMTSDTFLTWKGNKIFDVNTCKGMGINPDDSRNFEEDEEGVKDNHLHFEAMTTQIFAERERNREAQYDGIDEELEPEEQETTIGIILKSKGYDDFAIKVRPSTKISNLISAFRSAREVDDSKTIILRFDGDDLDPEEIIGETELDDMFSVDVYIN